MRIGCGLFTVFIRYFGAYNEGVCYSIMVMNCFAPLIDRSVKPARFGVAKSDKRKEAASK
jgi:electron transport complex protein RnfD